MQVHLVLGVSALLLCSDIGVDTAPVQEWWHCPNTRWKCHEKRQGWGWCSQTDETYLCLEDYCDDDFKIACGHKKCYCNGFKDEKLCIFEEDCREGNWTPPDVYDYEYDYGYVNNSNYYYFDGYWHNDTHYVYYDDDDNNNNDDDTVDYQGTACEHPEPARRMGWGWCTEACDSLLVPKELCNFNIPPNVCYSGGRCWCRLFNDQKICIRKSNCRDGSWTPVEPRDPNADHYDYCIMPYPYDY